MSMDLMLHVLLAIGAVVIAGQIMARLVERIGQPPVIGEVLSALGASDGVRLARMSGSGATCFALCEKAAEAEAAAEKIREHQPGWWVHAGKLS